MSERKPCSAIVTRTRRWIPQHVDGINTGLEGNVLVTPTFRLQMDFHRPSGKARLLDRIYSSDLTSLTIAHLSYRHLDRLTSRLSKGSLKVEGLPTQWGPLDRERWESQRRERKRLERELKQRERVQDREREQRKCQPEEPEERRQREKRERKEELKYWKRQARVVKVWRAKERDRYHAGGGRKGHRPPLGQSLDRVWERQQQEKREQQRALLGERLQRWAQFLQLLNAPPEGRLLKLLSSFIFIMLAILALELVGWFIFLGLLITIVAYLLLIISPGSTPKTRAPKPTQQYLYYWATTLKISSHGEFTPSACVGGACRSYLAVDLFIHT
ncbi:hypothetical protein B0H14DRAFT_2836277 [Mycena olivaceomarginata]|nr:hypothetical protein B0H14DRAFT_2836277 [Mycena olivaceomarginata]